MVLQYAFIGGGNVDMTCTYRQLLSHDSVGIVRMDSLVAFSDSYQSTYVE